LVDMAGRYSFSDSEDSARNARSATPSDLSSVDERHQHHHLKSTPPLPTQPLVLTMPSVPVVMASGSINTMPATPTKGSAMLMSHIRSVKKWGMRQTISMPSEVIGGLFSCYSFFFPIHFLTSIS